MAEIDDILRKQFELFRDFVETIHSMSIHKLLESTEAGRVYNSELDRICGNISRFNRRLEEIIFEEQEPKEFEFRNVIRDLNIIRTPTVLSIMENVFSDEGYDNEDKRDVHLRKYKLIVPEFKFKKEFSVSQEELEEEFK